MKKKVCIKKIVVCFVLVVVVSVQSIEPSFAAVEWYHAFSPLAVFIDKMAASKDDAALEDAIALGYSFWRSSPSSSYAVVLSRDTLDELCSQLNQAGFPCYVGYRADVYGGAYCIVGNGYLTVSSNSYADRKFNVSGRVYTNSDGEAYLSHVSYTANDYLGRMDNLLQSIDDHLDNIYYRVTKFYDYVTGSPNGASPGVSLYDKLDQVINAINGISVSGGSFDVTPIVDKLQEVVDALDTTSITDKLQETITAIQGSSTPIVGELQNIFKRLMAVDFATNERVDALLAEIQKISTHGGSDLTPVVMRLDTIIENLNATVGVAGCNHTYRDELDQEPTCILPGLMNHICSQCGSCYSEIVPSLGHNWEHKGYTNEQLNWDGEIVQQAHHLFECRRCGELFYDFQNVGDPDAVPDAPAKESDSLSSIIARLFEKLGNFAGELLSGIIKLLDKLLTGFDDVVTGFNEKAEQIATVGGDYPQWLSGVWGIMPADLQLVLTFCVIAMCVAVIGKKIFFVS